MSKEPSLSKFNYFLFSSPTAEFHFVRPLSQQLGSILTQQQVIVSSCVYSYSPGGLSQLQKVRVEESKNKNIFKCNLKGQY